jgi:hypothetical protein
MTTNQTGDGAALDTGTEALLAELGRVAGRKSRQNRWLRPLVCLCAFYALAYGVGYFLHLPVPANYTATLELLSNLALGVGFLATMPEFFFWKRTEKIKDRLRMLVKEAGRDSRAVGAIAQLCLPTQFLSISDTALEALLKLLPDVTAKDARYISDGQMQALLSLLAVHNQGIVKSRYSTELPLAILKALEQIGDSRAIESVQSLTTGKTNRLYHQVARECLIALKQHGEERERNRSLLLPSSLEAGPETLLRATTWKEEAQPNQLLRAATHQEEE